MVQDLLRQIVLCIATWTLPRRVTTWLLCLCNAHSDKTKGYSLLRCYRKVVLLYLATWTGKSQELILFKAHGDKMNGYSLLLCYRKVVLLYLATWTAQFQEQILFKAHRDKMKGYSLLLCYRKVVLLYLATWTGKSQELILDYIYYGCARLIAIIWRVIPYPFLSFTLQSFAKRKLDIWTLRKQIVQFISTWTEQSQEKTLGSLQTISLSNAYNQNV